MLYDNINIQIHNVIILIYNQCRTTHIFVTHAITCRFTCGVSRVVLRDGLINFNSHPISHYVHDHMT